MKNMHRPNLETSQHQQGRTGNHPQTKKGEGLQLPIIRTYQARLHKQQAGTTYYIDMVLAVQLDDAR